MVGCGWGSKVLDVVSGGERCEISCMWSVVVKNSLNLPESDVEVT